MKRGMLQTALTALAACALSLAVILGISSAQVKADGYYKVFEQGMVPEASEVSMIEVTDNGFDIIAQEWGLWLDGATVSGCSVRVATGASLHISDSLEITGGGSLTSADESARLFLGKGVETLPTAAFYYVDEETGAYADMSTGFWASEISAMGDDEERAFVYRELSTGLYGWTFEASHDFMVMYDGDFAPEVYFRLLSDDGETWSDWYRVADSIPEDNDGRNFFINPEIYWDPENLPEEGIWYGNADGDTIEFRFAIGSDKDFVYAGFWDGDSLFNADDDGDGVNETFFDFSEVPGAENNPIRYQGACEDTDNKKTLYVKMNYSDRNHNFAFTVAYHNPGNPEIVKAVKRNLYAFDNNYEFCVSDELIDRMKYALASKLYYDFIKVPMFERFGFQNTDDYYDSGNILTLLSRINIEDGEPVSASASSGAISIPTFKADVDWGLDQFTGEPIKSEDIVVYALPIPANEVGVLVCTDFDEETGTGSQFWFKTSNEAEKLADTDMDSLVIDCELTEGSCVVAGGNSYIMQSMNRDSNLLSFDLYTTYAFYRDSPTLRVRILDSEKSYILVSSSGEEKNYDSVKNDDGSNADNIWEVGGTLHARVFVGETSVTLTPVTEIGDVDALEVVSVELKDIEQAEGVEIEDNLAADGTVKVNFLSNFYDTVTLIVKYADDTEKEFVIERQGLVIQYMYLGGPKGDDTEFPDYNPATGKMTTTWEYDCYGREGGPSYTYGPAQLDEFGNPFDWGIVVMAVFYHPTSSIGEGSTDLSLVVTYDDGAMEIISNTDTEHDFNGYTSGAAYDAVDTTAFILGFLPSTTSNGNMIDSQYFERNGHTGGLSVTVVNAGYDDDDSFGGAQFGSGKGYHWNGLVEW